MIKDWSLGQDLPSLAGAWWRTGDCSLPASKHKLRSHHVPAHWQVGVRRSILSMTKLNPDGVMLTAAHWLDARHRAHRDIPTSSPPTRELETPFLIQ